MNIEYKDYQWVYTTCIHCMLTTQGYALYIKMQIFFIRISGHFNKDGFTFITSSPHTIDRKVSRSGELRMTILYRLKNLK